MKPNGHFVMERATLTVVEASIYESRRGLVETNIYDLIFDDGEIMKVKSSFNVNIEEIEVMGEDEDGQVVLSMNSYGVVQTFGEDREILFECKWQLSKEPKVVISNNLILELKAPVEYAGVGVNGYAGHNISGQMMLELGGFDSSGMGIYKISGEGTIHQNNGREENEG
jgi:hypothetical protein